MTSEKKTILLLGGSRQQVPVIEKARELGYRTVLIDYLTDNPGQFVADKWYSESTTDIEAVYRIAKEEKAKGILAYASDPAALPAAIVCERLGLPSNPARSIEILGVKHEFRKFLKDNDFASPASITFSPEIAIDELSKELSKLKFPIVIKPTDSSGSKGVTFLNNLDNLKQAIAHADEYSRNKILIAEEYIQRGFPYVIGGDIFIEEGKIILLGQMACMRENDGKALIPIGKRLPSGITPSQESAIRGELQRLIDILSIKTGEMNVEIILDDNSNVHFLELGPRAGGNMIPIQLSDAFGIDLIKANVLAAMGVPINLNPRKPKGCYMTYVLHSLSDGIYENVAYSSELEPFIYRRVHYKKPGDIVEKFDGAGKALGIVFMRFPDEKTMADIQSRLSNLIKIVLK